MSTVSSITPTPSFHKQATAWWNVHSRLDAAQAVSNLGCRLSTIAIEDIVLPVTVSDEGDDNSWICSPYTAYVRYAIEELDRFGKSWLLFPLKGLCLLVGAMLRVGRIDRAVAVNNWLLSTNLYPVDTAVDFASLMRACRERWPTHAIWFRSLNHQHNSDILSKLRHVGCVLIPSRQIYLFRNLQRVACLRHNVRLDLALKRNCSLMRVCSAEIGDLDYDAIKILYECLYIDKYSSLNPRYTSEFLRNWHLSGLLHFIGYRDGSGRLLAIVGLYICQGVVTAPIVGYDTKLPRKLGLYRLLMIEVIDYARSQRMEVNLSAGAADFKRKRGGVGVIEYSAVYVAHLPLLRRLAIYCLSLLCRGIGVPLMKVFRL